MPTPRRSVATAMAAVLAVAAVVMSLGAPPPAAQSATGDIVATAPARLLDTRAGEETSDGLFEGDGRLAAGDTLELTVAGRPGVPAGADAAFLNVVAISPSARGFLTIYPCGEDLPTAASLNYDGGSVTANATLARIGADSSVCIYTSVETHLVADVTGNVPADGTPTGVVPARLFDSRVDPSLSTVDGLFLGGGDLAAGSVTRFTVAGRGGVPDDARAVLMNVTAVNPTGRGWLTIFGCDTEVPTAANLNYDVGNVVGNGVLTELDEDGSACIFTPATVNVVVDATAYVPVDRDPTASEPVRLLETRFDFDFDFATIDGDFWRTGKLYGDTTTQLVIGGRWFVPDGIDAAFINVTAINPEAAGFLTIFPCGTDRPLAASLNFDAGETRANSVLVKVGGGSTACIYSSADTQLVVDLNGWIDDPDTAPPPEAPPTTRPSATPDTIPEPIPPQPATPPSFGDHTFLIDEPGFNRVRWNPCRPIRYAVNLELATPEQIFYMNEGIAEVERLSGLDLQYVGPTSAGHEFDVPSGADAVLTFSTRDRSSFLNGAIGVGGPSVRFYGSGQARIQSGGVIVDIDQMTNAQQPLVWMHELGHMLNLGHVQTQTELMFPSLGGQNGLGPGDREGLWRVGAAQGCLNPIRSSDRLVRSELIVIDD